MSRKEAYPRLNSEQISVMMDFQEKILEARFQEPPRALKEEFFAMPPIELIRQFMDHDGWYDRLDKEKPFKTLKNLIFVSAMGPPGGGRQSITQRLQRHYNFLTYTEML